MRKLQNLNIEKSIATKKLQYTKSWGDYVDPFLFSGFILFGCVICPLLLYRSEVNYNNPNDKFMAICVFPIVIAIGIYWTYNKLKENFLRRIKTKFNQKQNHQLIIDFAKNENYRIRRNNKNCIILDRFESNEINGKSVILFVLDARIYYTMIRSSDIINPPTFISHHIFSRRIRKWLINSYN